MARCSLSTSNIGNAILYECICCISSIFPNIRVAHNLMRLIAEGFGDEDEGADSQLRSSAVDSYLQIVGEPKLPSSFLQIICWVLGEYGTTDGKYLASYIVGKLCDVAEAHPIDDTVKDTQNESDKRKELNLLRYEACFISEVLFCFMVLLEGGREHEVLIRPWENYKTIGQIKGKTIVWPSICVEKINS